MEHSFAFFGTPRFAEITLNELIKNGHVPSIVVCNPDRPIGRKKIITPPPTKLIAQKHNIPISQPESLTNYKLPITDYGFAIVAAYGKIIPKELISSFPNGIIGVHPSLLPKYRGPSPIQTAIFNGETETGVTLFLLDEKVDHGKILAKSELQIAHNDIYTTLEEKLAKQGAELLIKILPDYLSGKLIPQEQNHAEATFTKKFTVEDAFISPDILETALQGDKEKAEYVDHIVRALNPEPGVWTFNSLNGEQKRMKILETRIESQLDNENSISINQHASTNPRQSALKLVKIQIEGKKPQTIN